MKETANSRPFLSFQIVKRYPGFELDCEARFQSGVTALFGPSGSGKTTLLNCIAGLATPDDGQITAGGDTVYDGASRRSTAPEKRRFGYVFQNAALFPHMSVWDNIRYGYDLTPRDLRTIDPEQMLELFRLARLRDRGVADLSGGERQRVALARALASSPRLLLLDEPLASLDVAFRGTILRYLKRVWQELGVPIVYVSHSVSEVLALAEDALVLASGETVVQGKPQDVLVHPGVDALADYATLENLLEAEVVSRTPARLRIGNVEVSVPEVESEPGEAVTVSIRAGDVILALEVPSKISAQNILEATIDEVHTRSNRVLVYVDIRVRLVVEITPEALRDLELKEGQPVHLIIKSTSILVMDSFAKGG